jgi:hypothetical protein
MGQRAARLVGRVRESNRQARDARDRWASHRARVMAVLDEAAPSGRLALLGAGHLHDVDLDALLARHPEVTLVDLDPAPAEAAVRRAGPGGRAHVVAPVDLTGALDLLAGVGDGSATLDVLGARLDAHLVDLPGAPFDATVSLGVLTQLMQAVIDGGVSAEHVPALSLAVRDKHLRDLVALTRPGGTCVLVTDIVSTTTAPELLDAGTDALEGHLARLVATRNFFTGTNPYRLVERFEARADIAAARWVGPWLWQLTADRAHLAAAVVAVRRAWREDRH